MTGCDILLSVLKGLLEKQSILYVYAELKESMASPSQNVRRARCFAVHIFESMIYLTTERREPVADNIVHCEAK